MRFGLGPLTLEPAAGKAHVDVYEEALEWATAAEWWGFDSVFVGEEPFGAGGQNPSSSVLGAAVAQRTEHVRIGIMPQLGLSHALYVAEEAACVDNLANGRLIVAARPPSEEALAGWEGAGEGGRERLAEDLRVLRLAWGPAPFAYGSGRYRIPAGNPVHREAQGLVELSVQPKPAQLDLPLWLSGGAEAAALARELGLPFLGPASLSLEELRGLYERPPGALAGVVPLCRDVVVARNGAEARERARALLPPLHGSDYEELARDRFVVGDPDEVSEELARYARELGVNYVVARVAHSAMTHAEALEAIRLFGQAVVPGFRMYGLPPEIRRLD